MTPSIREARAESAFDYLCTTDSEALDANAIGLILGTHFDGYMDAMNERAAHQRLPFVRCVPEGLSATVLEAYKYGYDTAHRDVVLSRLSEQARWGLYSIKIGRNLI